MTLSTCSTVRDALSVILLPISEVGLPPYGQYILSVRTFDEPKALNIEPFGISFADFIPPAAENLIFWPRMLGSATL
jgi:hypothetical protein